MTNAHANTPPLSTDASSVGPDPTALDAVGAIVPDTLNAGDAATYERLFRAHVSPLTRYAYSYVRSWDIAEDIVQDVFHQLWCMVRETGELARVKRYLFIAVRQDAIDYLRRERMKVRTQSAHGATADRPGVLPPEAEALLEQRELVAAIQRAVDELSPRQREVIQLRWQTQLTIEEIAQRMNVGRTSALVHLQRAVAHLRRSLPGFLAGLR